MLNKRAVWTTALLIFLLAMAIALGYVFRDKLIEQATPDTVMQNPNWFVAVPFLLFLVGLIVMGYLTDRKVNR